MLWITVYPDNIQTNIHMHPELLKTISELGVNFYITVMNL